MSVQALRARLISLRKNIPNYPKRPEVNDYNSIVDGFKDELNDPEVFHFVISDRDVKPRIVSINPGEGATYSEEEYCDKRVFTRQVEGLWAYLEDKGIVGAEARGTNQKDESRSQVIHFHGPVSGSTIQQGDHNTATVTYQTDVQRVLDEIRPLLNAAKLGDDAKQELRAEFETVGAQVKSPKPKHTIIRESLTSARHILEHAFGAGMAHMYFPVLIEFLKHH